MYDFRLYLSKCISWCVYRALTCCPNGNINSRLDVFWHIAPAHMNYYNKVVLGVQWNVIVLCKLLSTERIRLISPMTFRTFSAAYPVLSRGLLLLPLPLTRALTLECHTMRCLSFWIITCTYFHVVKTSQFICSSIIMYAYTVSFSQTIVFCF